MPKNHINTIYRQAGLLALQGTIIDVGEHRHRALQLLIPGEKACSIGLANRPIKSNAPLLINSQVPHDICCEDALLFLIDPACHLGKSVRELLAGHDTATLEYNHGTATSASFATSSLDGEIVDKHLAALGLSPCSQFHLQPRLEALLDKVDQAFALGRGGDVELNWALQKLPLSSSRFQHVFREQMGMPWRAWLSWTRLLSAATQVASGANLTDAAIGAGFSDSAHFSHTFKAMFGIAPARVALPPVNS